ncbi:hypothetical protein ACFL0Q_04295 [Thermodesulfobacteriota bacterium]
MAIALAKSFARGSLGKQTVCDLKARLLAFHSLCWLGVTAIRVSRAPSKETQRFQIGRFVRIRDGLNRFFDLVEKAKKEKRVPEKPDSCRKLTSEGSVQMHVCMQCGNLYRLDWLSEGEDFNDFGHRYCPFCGVLADEYAHIGKETVHK